MKIRASAEADETAVVALWRASGLIVRHDDPVADFRTARDRLNSDLLVGLDGSGQIVASVMVGHDGHRGWVYYVAVDPAQRRKGLGAKIVQAAEKWLHNHGARKAQLMIRDTNAGIADFYLKVGYQPSAVTVMQKWLGADK